MQYSEDDGNTWETLHSIDKTNLVPAFAVTVLYRIKPEPRVFYTNEYADGDFGVVFKNKENAMSESVLNNPNYSRTIKLIEVLED